MNQSTRNIKYPDKIRISQFTCLREFCLGKKSAQETRSMETDISHTTLNKSRVMYLEQDTVCGEVNKLQ